MGFSIGFGLVIVFALHGSRALSHPDPTVTAVIELAVGAVLIVVAVVALGGRSVHWHPRRSGGDGQQSKSLQDRAVGHDSVWIAWAAGALYSAPGAYYLAGLALLLKLDQPTATDVLAILGFNLVMFAFIELPLLGFIVAPERARAITQRFSDWMTRHKRPVIGGVAGVAGIYLVISGLIDLP